MKREGYIYDRMADWNKIVEAEAVSTRRRTKNFGVKKHLRTRMQNLVEIQENILKHDLHTTEYKHENIVSGQDKMRDISKLHFHPSHIQHQLLTMLAEERIDRALIRHTYASRKGYGQTRAALRIRDYLRKNRKEVVWYAQGDIRKYYASILHDLIRQNMSRYIKDEEFIDAFIEPFTKYSKDLPITNKSIPLGIRPSQIAGNIALMKFDRFMLEVLKCKGYTRYLDDFVFFGKTKGEVKWRMKRAVKYLNSLGFELHVPKICKIENGLDMLGFVFYNTNNDMFWRKADKRRWLKRRSRVTNPRRLRELDDAAWGMLKWGNRHCQRLIMLKTNRDYTHKMVSLSKCRIKKTERRDANGVPFIEGKKINMGFLLGKTIEVTDWVTGIKTSQGDGRYALRVLFMGDVYKVIINAVEIKAFFDDMRKNKVTKIRTVFVDRGGLRYAVDENNTDILEVEGREVEEVDGKIVFKDNKEEVSF